eukprot:3710360-Amphidinium_carterae.3
MSISLMTSSGRGLDGRIFFTRILRWVRDQLSARGSCAVFCDVCGASAGSTSLGEPSAKGGKGSCSNAGQAKSLSESSLERRPPLARQPRGAPQ